jgi:hypothetical protein
MHGWKGKLKRRGHLGELATDGDNIKSYFRRTVYEGVD